ncbi:MAG: glycosyltransferase [Planctomycetes bacterium]|uniref:glycosyltransferase n=1 Tax=Candidatus Wunengus sp. YC65 TaxID=3367701 RepID=UPI001DAA2683|nr:glycosyltransferase [Planctomycetota bacterium]
MKIAFFLNRFPMLSQTFVLNQITGLIDRGHEVDIYAIRPENDTKMHADVTKYNLLNRTHYFRDIPSNKLLRGVTVVSLLIKNYYRKPTSLLKFLRFSSYGKISVVKILCAIDAFPAKGVYDIIQCHFGPNGTLAVILRNIGVIEGKIVTTFHGYDISSYIKKNGDDVYKNLFGEGDIFLPISERWKNTLIELGCDERKIFVHRMGIDTSKFLFSPRNHHDNGKVRLLTICRLVEKKGVRYAIRAVAKVLGRYPYLEYKIAGDGPLKIQLEDLIKELNIQDNVKILGWKNQEEIVELLKDTDILIAPSITGTDGEQEGIPVALMEALAQGLPVLSTQHSGIPELIRDGESGFLVREGDVDALAERLEFFLVHPEIWSKMGRAGREHAEKYYNIDTLNDRLVGLYQELLAGKLS